VSIGGYEELLSSERPEFDWPMIDETSAYCACYSSVTTGKPKGVYYSHRCIYLHTLSIAMSTQLSLNDVVMQTVPMFHAQGWGVWLAAPMVGAKLVFPGPYTIETTGIIVDLMISEGVTFNCGAPAIFMPMLDYIGSLPEKPDFAGLRLISGATEPPLSMMKGYWDVGRVNVLHAYGSTETTPLVLLNRFKPGIKGWSDEQKWENQKKQGLLISGVEMKIVDAEGKEVPHDGQSVGEILFRGPWITRKYHEDERSEGGFVDGYWKSGDAGTIDEHGYVKVTDRIKDVIKSGGEWISSIDMENLIMSHHNVREASVVGIAHPKWQERPLALVVLREKAVETRTAGEIMALLGQTFAKWQLPDKIIFLDDIPKTSVGKFDKKAIRSVYKDHYLQE
jgi:fatty-acyl-CoA synthase